MDLDSVAVGKFHSLGQFLRGEVSGEGTHTKIRSRQIYGIGTVKDSHFQPFHITGRA